MTVVSVHIADVGLPKSLGLIRHPRPASIPGLLQANAGIAATFGTTPARPSPGRVGLIAFWQDDVALTQFESTHPLAAKLGGGLVLYARPLRIHGSWLGIGDDVPKQRDVEHGGPVLVLTLAKTKFSRFIPFSRASQPAERAVVKAPGNVFSSAVLRPPFISSVSVWESSDAAMDYAFSGHQAGHPEAIAAGRVKPFHHQEAFIRLAIDEIRGSLAGHKPLPPGAVRVRAWILLIRAPMCPSRALDNTRPVTRWRRRNSRRIAAQVPHCTFTENRVAGEFCGRSTVGAVNDVDAAVALELELLDPVCRVDPGRVAMLLADDFVEIGKSGRVLSRDDVVAALAAAPRMDGITVGPMHGQRIAAGLVVVRYTTHHHGGPGTVHRTGWWRQTTSGWQCWFHQATLVPEPVGEAAAVARVDHPVTQADIERSLRAVGVTSGSTVIVHRSLSELGWVVGNAVAVVRALRSVVGNDGTIVMPAQAGLSDPSYWQAPPVPESWWPTIRANWPAFDPMSTPLRGMGAVAECFARLPGVVHSGHPAVGFIAQGPRATELMSPHDLEDGLGDRSPLASLEAAGADIVLIGVGHGNNTALHLAESRALGAAAPRRRDGVPMFVDGHRSWVEYSHIDFDESDFVMLGDAYFAAGGTETRAALGAGEIRRLPMRELVDFAVAWIGEHRLQRF